MYKTGLYNMSIVMVPRLVLSRYQCFSRLCKSSSVRCLGTLSHRPHHQAPRLCASQKAVYSSKLPLYSRYSPSLLDANLSTAVALLTFSWQNCDRNTTVNFLRRYSSDGNGKQPEEIGMLKKGWRRFAGLISAFAVGTKALYRDVKRIYELRKRSGKYVVSQHAPREVEPGQLDFPFSREELQFIHQIRKDVAKMLPTVILFFIPLFGYIVPVIVFMYPQVMLSSHFWTAEMKQRFSKISYNSSTERFRGLAGQLASKGSKEQLEFLLKVKEFQTTGEWGEMQRLIQQNPKLPFKLPTKLAVSLCSVWGVGSWWLPISFQKRRLQEYLYHLFTVDWLIKAEGGVGNLSSEDITEACMERGLIVKSDSENSEVLDRYIRMTTTFKECPVSLIAHFPLAQHIKEH